MYCTNCGSVLESGKCPNCDFVDSSVSADSELPKRSKKSAKKVKEPKVRKVKQPKEKQPKEKQPMTKKKKVIIIVSAAAFIVLAGVGAFLAVYFVKDAQYNDAIELLRREKLDAAADSFEELGGFKNSPEFLEETLTMIDYFDAKGALEDGEYEDAISMFADLNGYQDSRTLEALAQQHFDYEAATALFDSGAFEQAKVAYLALGDFEESIMMVEVCQVVLDYDEAQTLYAAGQFLQAKNIFDTIPEFGDSKDMSFICDCVLTFDEAVDKIDSRLFSAAESMLKRLQKDINSSSINVSEVLPPDEISYYLGVSYFEQDLFYSAYQEFKKSTGFLDAASKAGKCEQPFKSEEIYINPDYTRNSVKLTLYAPEDGTENICVKIYEKSGELVSVCLIENDEKVKIYLPSGTYYYKISYGHKWYGEEEGFGNSFERVTFSDGTDTFKLSSSYYYWMNF